MSTVLASPTALPGGPSALATGGPSTLATAPASPADHAPLNDGQQPDRSGHPPLSLFADPTSLHQPANHALPGDTPAGAPVTPAAPPTAAAPADLSSIAATMAKPVTVAAEGAAPVESPVTLTLPPPVEMVAAALRVARPDTDGSWRVNLQLHPADLGEVNIVLEVRGGSVAVHIAADSQMTRSLLSEHLGDLRASLKEAGLETGTMDVGSRHPSTPQQGWRPRGGFSLPSIEPAVTVSDTPAVGPASPDEAATNHSLDLKL